MPGRTGGRVLVLVVATTLRGAAPCSTPCAGCPACPSAPDKCVPCPADCKPPALKAERMPLAAAYAPQGMGCYHDHATWLNVDTDKNYGPPLMKCGVWGCSGTHGCGGANVGNGCSADECIPWPAATPKVASCSDTEMTLETCIQACLAWSPSFVYAGVNFGTECYCDTALDTSQCRATAEDCSKPCPGDASQRCGGLWRVNVYQIRPDISLEVDETSWVFIVLLCAAALAYVLGGVLSGRGGRERGLGEPVQLFLLVLDHLYRMVLIDLSLAGRS